MTQTKSCVATSASKRASASPSTCYQVRDKALHGWRLESPSAERYTRTMPQFECLPSRILGLELGVAEGHLRCWRDGAELLLTSEIVVLLGRVLDEKEAVSVELAARATAEVGARHRRSRAPARRPASVDPVHAAPARSRRDARAAGLGRALRQRGPT